MADSWVLRLVNQPGETPLRDLDITFEEFGIAHGSFGLPYDDPLVSKLVANTKAAVILNGTVQAWIFTSAPSFDYQVEGVPFYRYEFTSYTVWYLTRRQLTEGFSGDAYQIGTGSTIDDQLKDIVRNNLGTSASASRQFNDFQVEANEAAGSTPGGIIEVARQDLLAQFVKIARFYDVDFKITGTLDQTAGYLAQFETASPRELDYSHDNTDSNLRVVYSPERGNVAAFRYKPSQSSANVVVVYGEGEGEFRTSTTVGSATGDSRHEASMDAREAETATARQVEGQAFLNGQGEDDVIDFVYVNNTGVPGVPLTDVQPGYMVTFHATRKEPGTGEGIGFWIIEDNFIVGGGLGSLPGAIEVQQNIRKIKARVEPDAADTKWDFELGFIRTELDFLDEVERSTGGGGSGGGKAGGGSHGGKLKRNHGHTGSTDGPQIRGSAGGGSSGIAPGTIGGDDLGDSVIDGSNLDITLDGVSWPDGDPGDIDLIESTAIDIAPDDVNKEITIGFDGTLEGLSWPSGDAPDIDLTSPNLTINITTPTASSIGFDVIASALPYADPNLTLGTTNTEGVANTVIRTDATILAFDATNPADIAGSAAVGGATVAARRDHVHRGVVSIQGPAATDNYGTITLAGGTGISISEASETFTFAVDQSEWDFADTSTDVSGSASSAGSGSNTEPAVEDHTHRGVASIRGPAATDNYGTISLAEGTGISISEVSETLTITVDATEINLNDLGDVTITSPANDAVLAYNSGTAQWIDQVLAISGSVSTQGSTTDVSRTSHTHNFEFTTGSDSHTHSIDYGTVDITHIHDAGANVSTDTFTRTPHVHDGNDATLGTHGDHGHTNNGATGDYNVGTALGPSNATGTAVTSVGNTDGAPLQNDTVVSVIGSGASSGSTESTSVGPFVDDIDDNLFGGTSASTQSASGTAFAAVGSHGHSDTFSITVT